MAIHLLSGSDLMGIQEAAQRGPRSSCEAEWFTQINLSDLAPAPQHLVVNPGGTWSIAHSKVEETRGLEIDTHGHKNHNRVLCLELWVRGVTGIETVSIA